MDASTWAGFAEAAAGFAGALAGFAGAGAVIYAAHKGASSVDNWFAQRVAERKVLAAERIMTLAHRLKDEIAGIRAPGITAGELQAAEELLEKAQPGFGRGVEGGRREMIEGQVYWTRIGNRASHWADVFECIPLGRTYFSEEVAAALQTFVDVRQKIYAAAQLTAMPTLDRETREKVNGQLWGLYNKALGRPDEIDEQVETAIAAIDAALLQLLQVGNQSSRSKPTKRAGQLIRAASKARPSTKRDGG